MGLFDGIEKLINEHGSAVILKERIDFAKDQYVALEKKLASSEERENQLKSENEILRFDLGKAAEQIRHLEEKLSHVSTSQEYYEESGALFKRRPNGDWDYTPYCPSCQSAMVAAKRTDLYVCGKKSCGQRASFRKIDTNDVISRLTIIQQ